MKVSELTGANLALWVARALKLEDAQLCGTEPGETLRCEYVKHEEPGDDGWWTEFSPHEDWAVGGPLVAKYHIEWAWHWPTPNDPNPICNITWVNGELYRGRKISGPTELVAAMRALVASIYGANVPDEVAP